MGRSRQSSAERSLARWWIAGAAAGCASIASCAGQSGVDPPKLPKNPEGAPVGTVAAENSSLAFDLLRVMSGRREGNLFFSPHSISTAMAMVWAGAKGETEKKIADVMHWSGGQDATHRGFAGLANQLDPSFGSSDGAKYEWTSANMVWTGIAVNPAFSSRLAESYGSGSKALDFSKRDEASAAVNAWAKEWTRGHIERIVEPDDMRGLRVMLTNAVYFKGTWEEPFSKDATGDEPFRGGEGTHSVRMMRGTREMQYGRGDGYSAVSLPYLGGVSCVIVLPDEATTIGQSVEKLSDDGFRAMLASMREERVALSLPLLSLKTKFSARDDLKSLGMGLAFSDSADFSGISDREGLAISDVLHAATIDMDEVGTVATAVTAIGVRVTSAPMPKELIVFKVDRPYLVAIVHNATGEVMFLGRVMDPSAGG